MQIVRLSAGNTNKQARSYRSGMNISALKDVFYLVHHDELGIDCRSERWKSGRDFRGEIVYRDIFMMRRGAIFG